MNKELKFAIIGCGKIAPRHAEEITKSGKLVAVCDIIKTRADELATAYSAKSYYDIDSLLASQKDLDIISVCTPNGLHAEHAIKTLQAGTHVLCEKPLCITSAAAWQMVETARLCRRKLFVVKSSHYNPALQELKKLIENNDLGKLYSFQLNCFWNRPQSYYTDSSRGTLFPAGGTLYTQFSHHIDAMLWLFGNVSGVKGFRKNSAHQGIIEFEDNGVVAMEMENGMLGGLNWSVNTYGKNMEASLTLIAEKVSVRIGGEYMDKIDYAAGVDINVMSADTLSNEYGNDEGSMGHHDKIYEHLIKDLHNDKHSFDNAFNGLRTVELIEKIYNSVSLS